MSRDVSARDAGTEGGQWGNSPRLGCFGELHPPPPNFGLSMPFIYIFVCFCTWTYVSPKIVDQIRGVLFLGRGLTWTAEDVLIIWAHQKNRAPVTIRIPSDSQSSSMTLLNSRAPLIIRALLIIRPLWPSEPLSLSGALWISGVLWSSGTLWLSGALPTARGPLIIRGPSDHQGPSDNQGPSQLSGPSEYQGPLKFRHFYFSFFLLFCKFGPPKK